MAGTTGKEGNCLAFKLGEKTCGIDIANIQEVLKLPDVTPILGTREYIRGVIPVRGSVVPAVNQSLGKEPARWNDGQRIHGRCPDANATNQCRAV